ncbi:MAG: hypothetical protein MJ252_01940 [archaeon]|nr:hypothetical protein [archaeon]
MKASPNEQIPKSIESEKITLANLPIKNPTLLKTIKVKDLPPEKMKGFLNYIKNNKMNFTKDEKGFYNLIIKCKNPKYLSLNPNQNNSQRNSKVISFNNTATLKNEGNGSTIKENGNNGKESNINNSNINTLKQLTKGDTNLDSNTFNTPGEFGGIQAKIALNSNKKKRNFSSDANHSNGMKRQIDVKMKSINMPEKGMLNPQLDIPGKSFTFKKGDEGIDDMLILQNENNSSELISKKRIEDYKEHFSKNFTKFYNLINPTIGVRGKRMNLYELRLLIEEIYSFCFYEDSNNIKAQYEIINNPNHLNFNNSYVSSQLYNSTRRLNYNLNNLSQISPTSRLNKSKLSSFNNSILSDLNEGPPFNIDMPTISLAKFTYKLFSTKYQKKTTIDQKSLDFIISVDYYSYEVGYKDIQIFAKFLNEEYSREELLFFLFIRALIEQLLGILFIQKAQNDLEIQHIEERESLDTELYITKSMLINLSKNIFGREEDEMQEVFLNRLKPFMEKRKKINIEPMNISNWDLNSSNRSSVYNEEESFRVTTRSVGESRINANLLLFILLDDYHKSYEIQKQSEAEKEKILKEKEKEAKEKEERSNQIANLIMAAGEENQSKGKNTEGNENNIFNNSNTEK